MRPSRTADADARRSRARSGTSTAISPTGITNGEVDLQTPGVAEHLWQTTMESSPSISRITRRISREVEREG